MELCAHLTANFSADKSNQKASLSCVKKWVEDAREKEILHPN